VTIQRQIILYYSQFVFYPFYDYQQTFIISFIHPPIILSSVDCFHNTASCRVPPASHWTAKLLRLQPGICGLSQYTIYLVVG
jgi:hypothetical protein